MTTHSKNLMLIAICVAALQMSALACSNTSSPDVRNQPHPRTQRPVRTSQPAEHTMAPASSKPLKPGTPEYKKKLEQLTNLRPDPNPPAGTRRIRTDCGRRNIRTDCGTRKDCRDCARAIRRGTTPPAAKPKPMANGMDPR